MSIKDQAKEFSKTYDLKVFPLRGKAGYLKRLGPHWNLYASKHVEMFEDETWEEADSYGVTLEGFTVIDIDTINIRELELPDLKETLVIRTGRGFHFYYKGELPSGKNLDAYSHYPIQIKTGANAYVIGPGSFNYDHQRHYEYLRKLPIAAFNVNSWISQLNIDPEASDVRNILSRNTKIKEGSRNTTLTKVLGVICRYDINEKTVRDFALSFNKNQIEPPLDEKEVINTVKSIVKKQAEETIRHSPTDQFIENLISETKEEEYQVFTAKEVSQWPDPECLIQGMWQDSAVSFLLGRWGAYKSFIALDIAAKMSEGLNVLDEFYTVDKPLKVLYVAAEGVSGFKKRIKAAQFENIRLEFIRGVSNIYPKNDPAFYRLLDQKRYDVVFLDTFQKVRGTFRENISDDIKQLMEPLDKCHSDIGTNFMFVHHKGKGESLFRGSDAIVADAGNVWTLLDKSKAERQVTLASLKLKDLEDFSLRVTLGKDEENDSLYVDSYYRNDIVENLEVETKNIIDVTKEKIIEAVLAIKNQKDESGKHPLEYLMSKPDIYKLIQKELEDRFNGEAKIKPIRDILNLYVLFQKIEGRWLWVDWVDSSD